LRQSIQVCGRSELFLDEFPYDITCVQSITSIGCGDADAQGRDFVVWSSN